MIAALVARLTSTVVPFWARLAALAALVFAAYGYGRLQEARSEAAKVITQTVTVVKHETQTVHDVQVKYVPQIQKIYVQGDQIEKAIPDIIPADVDRRLPLPAGLVRVLDAVWSGDTVGPASDADRGPSSVPPSVVAENEVDNATSCKVWRKQSLGWREFYAKQQVNLNGKAGAWYKPEE